MANSRPTSMIISPGVLDEANTNGSKNVIQKKTHHHAGAKSAILTEKQSLAQMNSTATVSSTTTDSELESEQEERYMDDNNSSESSNLPIQIQNQKSSKYDNGQQKIDANVHERLSRRVKHFQKLFKSEIADDMPQLIDSYVCAYQGDILLQGKMYITDRYLCFHSRIISYVTKHVYRWEQIENVSKERVAFIFPTAIGIQLKSTGKKIIYASFLQREQAFDKILSICSRFNNDTNSFQDDEENNSIQSGTLKAINSNNRGYNEKLKKSKRDMHFEIPDEPEHDVLQMCLRQEKPNHNKRQEQSISSKSSDDKQQSSKKFFNSDKNKSSSKTSNIDQFLSNDLNENILVNNQIMRNSRYSQNQQQKQIDTTKRSSSAEHRQSNNNPSLRTHSSHSRDRTLSSTNLPHSNSTTNIDSLLLNSNNDGLIKKYFRIIILSVISIIKLIIEYLLLLYNQFKTYPVKTSLILLIFIIILITHSFYLIKLAYRIENRLQSLHHKWPSSMKNSLPSLKEL